MKTLKGTRRATTFQIVGTFLVIISAFILVSYIFIENIRSDFLKYKEGSKEYAIISARKMPEYSQLSGEEGAYQAVYEVGMRGGYVNGSISNVKKVATVYTPIELPNAMWMNETVDKTIPTGAANIVLTVPTDRGVEANLTEIIRNFTYVYMQTYAVRYNIDPGIYANATVMVNRTRCITTAYQNMGDGCFNITVIPTNYTTKTLESGGLVTQVVLSSPTKTHLELRFFKMYDLMRSFMRNNFLIKEGHDISLLPPVTAPFNTLAAQLEGDKACPAGSNCDWDTKSHVTEWCPGQNNCDLNVYGSGLHARLDYSCVSELAAPACKRTIRKNIIDKVGEIQEKMNTPEAFGFTPYNIKCPYATCEPNYAAGARDVYQDPVNADSYETERFNWSIKPAPDKTWNDVISWDGSSDDYNVLWWDQDAATGQCRLPQGFVFKTDTSATVRTPPSMLSSSTNIEKDSWTKTDFLGNELFPEGSACADAYFVDCHEIKQYKTHDGGGTWWNCCGGGSGGCFPGPSPAWCEMKAYQNDVGHQAGCGGAAYGNGWCEDLETTVHYNDVHSCSCSCPWTSCPSTYGECHTYQDPALNHVIDTKYTHCDIKYDFYGHFKYRARVDPLQITVTDESKAMPVTDIYGLKTVVEPQLNAIYGGVVYEAPVAGDRCLDVEADENKANDRYYHAGDVGQQECPKAKNPNAPNLATPKPNYYTSQNCNTCTDADGTCYYFPDYEVCMGGVRLSGAAYCSSCASCTDGIKDCGEDRVDCGGTCAPCADCSTLTCTTAPNTCCGRAEDNIEECVPPNLDFYNQTCVNDCECWSNLCNTTTNKCANPFEGCPPMSTGITFEEPVTADGCALNLSVNLSMAAGTQYKIETVYQKGGFPDLRFELCRTGQACLTEVTLPSTNANCNIFQTYSTEDYYPWNCSQATPIVPSDYQLTKVRLTSLSGVNINLFGLNISAKRMLKPTRCTSCGGTAYWDYGALQVSPIAPGTCVDGTPGTTADILGLISCEATTGMTYNDENANGIVNLSEVFNCCDGIPPVINPKKPVFNCGETAYFGTPCSFKLNATTDEDARCRYSEGAELAYDTMTNTMDAAFTKKREIPLGLTNAIQTYYIACSNLIGVKTPLGSACGINVDCMPIGLTLNKPVAGCGGYVQYASPCAFNLNVTTNQDARCRYSTGAEVAYSAMTSSMDAAGTKEREVSDSLTNANRTYFIACNSTTGNKYTPLGSACSVTVNCTA